jgi:anti-anti-sigma factor
MRVTVREVGDVRILTGVGQMTIASSGPFFDCFMEQLESGGRWFIFDLHRVRFLDSCSIGELVACYKRARDRGGRIHLVLNRRAQDMFTFLSLQPVFGEFGATVEEALGSFLHRTETRPAAAV